MKRFLSISIFIFLLAIINIDAQSFTAVPDTTDLSGSAGSEMTFHINLSNISNSELQIEIVRTVNDLPDGWTSSICLDVCYQSGIDSVITNPDFNSSPLQPGESRELKIIVQTQSNEGIGNIQLRISDFRNTSDNVVLNLTVSTLTTSVKQEGSNPDKYFLLQNYPNPFNPATKIKFSIKEAGNVKIKVFDLLGNEIATLFNGYQTAGRHEVEFDAHDLSSGIYIYRVVTKSFQATRKMILEK